eukprot:TRINITY_DN65372_c0_g1_i1.p1 TRINITY_DN65372_c0_g1~~TRINITY_DN65372_c0_g1_i1.p1  ORF type:complete len:516 (+),score=61.78 TRINITY_DN65372_c0_g1_i1:277-1824(+)
MSSAMAHCVSCFWFSQSPTVPWHDQVLDLIKAEVEQKLLRKLSHFKGYGERANESICMKFSQVETEQTERVFKESSLSEQPLSDFNFPSSLCRDLGQPRDSLSEAPGRYQILFRNSHKGQVLKALTLLIVHGKTPDECFCKYHVSQSELSSQSKLAPAQVLDMLKCESVEGLLRDLCGRVGDLPSPLPLLNVTKKMRILAIDGGGIGGVIPATILCKLEEVLQRPLYQVFDMICGTSTGGLIALALGVAKKSAEEVLQLFKTDASGLFPDHSYRRLFFQGHRYSRSGFKALAQKHLNCQMERQSEDLCDPDPYVFVTAEMRGSVFLFRNYENDGLQERPMYAGVSGQPAWEAALCTAAAPTYFEPYVKRVGQNKRSFRDGGIVANNPVKVAFEEALNISRGKEVSVVVSCGCGRSDDSNQASRPSKASLCRTGEDLIGILTQTENTLAEVERMIENTNRLQEDSKTELFRLNPVLTERYRLDDVSQVEHLHGKALGYWKSEEAPRIVELKELLLS